MPGKQGLQKESRNITPKISKASRKIKGPKAQNVSHTGHGSDFDGISVHSDSGGETADESDVGC